MWGEEKRGAEGGLHPQKDRAGQRKVRGGRQESGAPVWGTVRLRMATLNVKCP